MVTETGLLGDAASDSYTGSLTRAQGNPFSLHDKKQVAKILSFLQARPQLSGLHPSAAGSYNDVIREVTRHARHDSKWLNDMIHLRLQATTVRCQT